MKITIQDIAKKAGVSKATVSYVINNKEGVGEETRKKILKIIEDLNYKPNLSARNLAGKKTKMIGLIIPDITDMFYAGIIKGVENTANKYDYTLNLCTTHGESDKEYLLTEQFSDGRVDALILMVYHLDKKYINKLKQKNIPLVLIGNPVNGEKNSLPFIIVNNKKASYEATNYLIELGHKDIAFIRGSSDSWDAKARYQGYRMALKDKGLPARDQLIKNGNFLKESGYEKTKELLKSNRPTAIFAANDRMAIGAVNAVKEEGLNIPDQISILGFDDIEACRHINPPLTTIRQPTRKMGEKAVKMSIKLINQEKIEEEKILLPARLIKRESCSNIR